MFKTASIVEVIFEIALLIACGVAWAMAGFPRATEVATLSGLAIVGLGAYVGIRRNKK